ncbi:hypothetical protein GALMADRAFT_242111 [Galerina marginata CBS 339.88]|uniref:Uncharacterized protein n=1 Tax=Galerina marginata (strain CBS 339.88) TaxID=685588 RepID=A0A067TA25_GALM3|nr:hypothetical protein GALMADRAFT_242111 [Galerina marginata CBS 339.88]
MQRGKKCRNAEVQIQMELELQVILDRLLQPANCVRPCKANRSEQKRKSEKLWWRLRILPLLLLSLAFPQFQWPWQWQISDFRTQ